MNITTSVTIGFKIPEECAQAEKIRAAIADKPEWREGCDTNYIYFTATTFVTSYKSDEEN